jgi:hypothetical protein
VPIAVVIEVDGVLERRPTPSEVRFEEPDSELAFGVHWVVDPSTGEKVRFRTAPDVIWELNDIVVSSGAAILWLTRWAPEINRLCEWVFNGLRGGSDITPDIDVPDMRFRAVAGGLRRLGSPPLVWVDTLPASYRAAALDAELGPSRSARLIVEVNPEQGLMWDDLDAIRTFIAAQAGESK